MYTHTHTQILTQAHTQSGSVIPLVEPILPPADLDDMGEGHSAVESFMRREALSFK